MTVPVMVVRADASVAVGLGHAMRCLALAQALADARGGRAVFLLGDPPPALVARLTSEGAEVEALGAPAGTPDDARATLAAAERHGAAWIVIDGYELDGSYQAALVAGGAEVLALDDHGHAGAYHAHLVLNQNLGADGVTYPRRDPRTRLLLGPRYALLRREFATWGARPAPAAEVARRVLVTLGGSDPDDVSSRVIAGLGAIGDPLEIEVLIGGANPHRAALERAASACPHPVELVADAVDMPERMAGADLAVSAAGGTARELARVGTPQATIVLADNQRPAGDALAAAGVALLLGWHADVTAEQIAERVGALARDREARAEQARRGPDLVDGKGAGRVLAAMGLAAA